MVRNATSCGTRTETLSIGAQAFSFWTFRNSLFTDYLTIIGVILTIDCIVKSANSKLINTLTEHHQEKRTNALLPLALNTAIQLRITPSRCLDRPVVIHALQIDLTPGRQENGYSFRQLVQISITPVPVILYLENIMSDISHIFVNPQNFCSWHLSPEYLAIYPSKCV